MNMRERSSLHIATSGWYYDHWRGPFYPPGLPKSSFLKFYSERFSTVEINNSFYRLPEEKTLKMWREAVPPGFIFSVKASRLITHNKKLKDPETTLPKLFERITALGDELGPVLFQLPPAWRLNKERLKTFLDTLSPGFRYAFEFRDPSWFDEGVFELLREKNAAFCVYEFDRILSPKEVTADFAYVRLHGPGGKYRGSYDDEALKGWAATLKAWLKQGVAEVFCYFDNDEAGYAALNAMRLNEILGLRKYNR